MGMIRCRVRGRVRVTGARLRVKSRVRIRGRVRVRCTGFPHSGVSACHSRSQIETFKRQTN